MQIPKVIKCESIAKKNYLNVASNHIHFALHSHAPLHVVQLGCHAVRICYPSCCLFPLQLSVHPFPSLVL